jgi:hypothetical protein
MELLGDMIVRPARIRENLGLRFLPKELHCNYNKLERMGISSLWEGNIGTWEVT